MRASLPSESAMLSLAPYSSNPNMFYLITSWKGALCLTTLISGVHLYYPLGS